MVQTFTNNSDLCYLIDIVKNVWLSTYSEFKEHATLKDITAIIQSKVAEKGCYCVHGFKSIKQLAPFKLEPQEYSISPNRKDEHRDVKIAKGQIWVYSLYISRMPLEMHMG